ncbi:MAG: galactose-1-phosphate uridylyltransferase [Spirochaetales bacterium]|nr:galactose-1-phosphate uridylyltransferase [Spirochaetales bacterium]
MNLKDHSHTRYNPLIDRWILVSPHRTKRPWQGKTEQPARDILPSYDPDCYLCPRNARAGGKMNPDYSETHVFPNDFAAILPDAPSGVFDNGGLLQARGERGICRVICFSPKHNLTLARMDASAISRIIETWKREYADLGSMDFIKYVQIFENKGEIMGCSNPHPHGQIWSNETVPQLPLQETDCQLRYNTAGSRCMLCSYLELELLQSERLVLQNASFVGVVPFWAVWPFETMILPRRHITSVSDLTPAEIDDFAEILKRIGTRYDNLFETNFPYSMGIHQKPTDGAAHDEWHMHVHFFPPLLRSATVKKFMVGYEMLAMPQRDITAEMSADRLRKLPDEHYAAI